MYADLPGVHVLLAAIALTPSLALWWRGRSLARMLDDPALPERLEAAGHRNGALVAIAFSVLVVLSPASMAWTLPLLIIGHIVASYPLRKTLYRETWTLRGYLGFVGRIVICIWGFWLLLGLLPFLAWEAGRFDWLVATAGAGALLVWNARYEAVLRRVVGSRPVTDPALLERFTAIVHRSSVGMPRFEWIPLRGGAIPNAIAVPAHRQSSVLFTETLLVQMDADETTAICAHEIAHLEQHTPRVLRRIALVNVATIATGACFAVLPRLAGWDRALLLSVLWLVVLVAAVAWRARDRQKNETASDVRAVALTGDPEALVRALTKLCTFARMPRRVDPDLERRATHPSLARRIRDIRAAAGSAPAALGDTSIFGATDGRTTVTFDNDRLHWTEGDVATHSLSYSQFSALRLQIVGGSGPSLLAVERGGRRWHAAIAPNDVPRLQAVLDIVDGRLTSETRAPATFGNMARAAAGFAAMFALAASQIGMAIAALIALMQPSTPLLAGAGVAGLASAVVTGRVYAGMPADVRLGLASMLALLGLGLLATAYMRRGDHLPPRTMIGIAILAICAMCSTVLLLLNGLNPIALHLAARSTPATAVFLLALGTTLAFLRPRLPRYAAVPLLLGGVTVLAAGSPLFLDRFGRDPFLQPARPISWTSVAGSLQGESHVPFYASAVELSPAGDALIVHAYDAAEEDSTVHVGRVGAPLTRVRAAHLVFVDDDRILGVYGTSTGTMEIRETSVDAPEAIVWRRPVPEINPHSFSYEPATRTWTVRGLADDGAVVQVEGGVDAGNVRERRWPSLGVGRRPEQTAATGDAVLVHEMQYVPSLVQRSGWWRLALLLPGRPPHSRFSRVKNTARSDAAVTRFQAECVSASVAGSALLCSAFDGSRTRFASIDPETAQVTALAWLPGRFRSSVLSSSGWLSGWADWHAVALRPATQEGIRFDAAPERPTQLTATERAFAAVSMRDGGSVIRVYAREQLLSSQLSAVSSQ